MGDKTDGKTENEKCLEMLKEKGLPATLVHYSKNREGFEGLSPEFQAKIQQTTIEAAKAFNSESWKEK